MSRALIDSWKKILLSHGLCASIVCGVTPSFVQAANVTVNTTTESMLVGLDAASGYEILPLLTSGEEIPLLVGRYPDLWPLRHLTYRLPGIPDGMGIIEGETANWLILQHEQDGDPSDLEDFQQTVFSSTFKGYVPGARISLLKFTKTWQIIGGTLLINEFLPTNYLLNEDGGPLVAAGSKIDISFTHREYFHSGHIPSSFCAGTLATTGFFDPQTGEPSPVWFASEEDDGYSGISWAVFPNGQAQPIEGLGVTEKEQTLPLREHRPALNGRTIIVTTDDETDGEIYLWIGQPTSSDPNGFNNGQLYAMKVEGAARESGPAKLDGVAWSGPDPSVDPISTIGGVGESKRVTWTPIPVAMTRTGDGLTDYVTGHDANGATRATSFLYPEDLDEDPNVPGRLYLAANGGADQVNWDGEEERYENPYGRIYQIDLNIDNPDDPATWGSSIKLLLEGGAGKGLSYDNLLADSNGKLLLSEDLNQDPEEADAVWNVLKTEQRAPWLVSYDTRSGQTLPVFELNQPRHDPQLDWSRLNALIADDEEDEARDTGFWEASGMIEIPGESQPGRSAYMIGVQAHSLKPSGLAEGGQLLLVRPIAE